MCSPPAATEFCKPVSPKKLIMKFTATKKLFTFAIIVSVLTNPVSAQHAPTLKNAGNDVSAAERSKQQMAIARAGTQASIAGPAQNFTGRVRIDPLFNAEAPATASGAYVTFEPNARSDWHTHPKGQVLLVTAGVGRVQQWGGQVQEIRPGDVVSTPPGVKHWHGAAPTTSVTHIAIQESVDDKNVEWLEKVSDEQYRR